MAMTAGELKYEATQEIESALWKLGNNDSKIFPNFEVDNLDLDYAIQNDGEDILLETRCFTGDRRKVFVRVKVEVEVE